MQARAESRTHADDRASLQQQSDSARQHRVSLRLQVGLMTISMVTCTLILGSILKNGKMYVSEKAEESFIYECHEFIESYTEGDRPPVPRRTFEKFWENRCEDDWRRAFQYFAWGVLSFLFSLIPIGWIKFSYSPLTAGLFAGVIAVSIFVWAFSQYYWGSYLTSDSVKEQLETHGSRQGVKPVGLPFDWHITSLAERCG